MKPKFYFEGNTSIGHSAPNREILYRTFILFWMVIHVWVYNRNGKLKPKADEL